MNVKFTQVKSKVKGLSNYCDLCKKTFNKKEKSIEVSSHSHTKESNTAIQNQQIKEKSRSKRKKATIKQLFFAIENQYIVFHEFINKLFFESEFSEDLEANFISKYDETNDKYIYFIERSLGLSIDENQVFDFYTSNIKDSQSTIASKISSERFDKACDKAETAHTDIKREDMSENNPILSENSRNREEEIISKVSVSSTNAQKEEKKEANKCFCKKIIYGWNIYINHSYISLNDCIEKDRILKLNDKIEFCFEQLN